MDARAERCFQLDANRQMPPPKEPLLAPLSQDALKVNHLGATA